MEPATPPPLVLDEHEWRERVARHEARVDALVGAHLRRRRSGRAHPVEDFLFTYYSYRPSALRRWHPGPGVVLADAAPQADRPGYRLLPEGAALDPAHIAARVTRVRWVRDLLAATASRSPAYGCLGLHEWAMVYRTPQDAVRHAGWPLRLGNAGTDQVVESHRITCTHHDAFRFFAPQARGRNTLRPTRERQAQQEQPGCLHANMDLYKWAYKLAPMTPSELVADCFELAREVRELDMRASPYDLRDLGYTPVRIETGEGKREYADAQRAFTARAAPLRERLVGVCDALLRIAAQVGEDHTATPRRRAG